MINAFPGFCPILLPFLLLWSALVYAHFVSMSLPTTPQSCSTLFSQHHFPEKTVNCQKQPINCQVLPCLFSLHLSPSLHGICHWWHLLLATPGFHLVSLSTPPLPFRISTHTPRILSCKLRPREGGDGRQKGCLQRWGGGRAEGKVGQIGWNSGHSSDCIREVRL